MIKKTEALSRISQQAKLAEIYEFEPAKLETLIDLALTCDDPAWRWEDYECLKSFASRIVGKYASCAELKTSAHYEILIAFLDWLLPDDRVVEQEQAS